MTEKLVDVKIVSNVDKFDGLDIHWRKFRLDFMIAVSNISLDATLSESEGVTALDLQWEILTGEQQVAAKKIYLLIAGLLSGKARTIFEGVQVNNGFLLWHNLCTEYENKSGNRATAMLTGLLAPNFERETKAGREFSIVLMEWEQAVERYKQQTGEPFTERMMCAIVTERAPPQIRSHIVAAAHQIDGSYTTLKSVVQSALGITRSYDTFGNSDSRPTPMEVGGVEKFDGYCNNCGKYGHKTKDCYSKSAKGKNKGTKGQDGKTKNKGKPTSQKFDGYCHECGKYGHKSKDCRSKKKGAGKDKNGKNKSGKGDVGGIDEQQPSAGDKAAGVGGIETSDMDMSFCFGIDHSQDMPASIPTVVGGLMSTEVLVSLDSGSDEHASPPYFGTSKIRPTSVKINDIGGTGLNPIGQRPVKYQVDDTEGNPMSWQNDFVVSSRIVKPVVSYGKVLKGGGVVTSWEPDHTGMCGHVQVRGRKFPIFMVRNSLYVKARVVGGIEDGNTPVEAPNTAGASSSSGLPPPQVIPPPPGMEQAMQEIPVTPVQTIGSNIPEIHPRTPVKILKDRCKQLGEPAYGTQLQLYQRIIKREHADAQESVVQDMLRARADRRRAATMLPTPITPTEAERKEHEKHHCPPMPWCEFCQLGKAKDKPHRARTADEIERGWPETQFDFMFLNSDCEMCEPAEAWATTLTGVDCDSGAPLCLSIPSKEANEEYTIANILSFLKRMNHEDIIVKSDGEPAIKALLDKVKEKYPYKMRTLVTPRYSSQSLGMLGAIQNLLQGQIRTLRASVEQQYSTVIGPSKDIWPWLVRHAGWQIHHCHIRGNRRTSYQEITGCQYNGWIVPFGETCVYRHAFSKAGRKPGAHIKKADLRFDIGIFVGKSFESDEAVIMTSENGTVYARTVRRLEESRKHQLEVLLRVTGVPWHMKKGGKSRQVQASTRLLDSTARGAASASAANPEPDQADVIPEAEQQAAESDSLKTLLELFGDTEPTDDSTQAISFPSSTCTSAVKRSAPDSIEAIDPAAQSSDTPVVEAQVQTNKRLNPVDYSSINFTDSQARFDKKPKLEEEPDATVGGVDRWDHNIDVPDEFDELEWWEIDEVEEDDGVTEAEEAAMWVEISWFDLFGVYAPISEEDAKGAKFLTTTWVRSGGDSDLRMRFCAREFKAGKKREDLYTPSSTSLSERGIDVIAAGRNQPTILLDAKNAYLHVIEEEFVVCTPPACWMKHHVQNGGKETDVWQLKKQLYGRRKASFEFSKFVNKLLTDRGFAQCPVLPNIYYNPETQIVLDTHQDDMHGTSTSHEPADEELEKFTESIREELLIKSAGLLRAPCRYHYLKTERIRLADGTFFKQNDKYVRELQRLLGLENCKPVPTPMVPCSSIDETPLLEGEEKKLWGRCNGICQFISKFRPDHQGTICTLGSYAKGPTQYAMQMMKRLVRYMSGTDDWGVWIPNGIPLETLYSESDTDWATDKHTRRSRTCGRVTIDNANLYQFVRNQSVIAQSSGEAEYYGAVSTTYEALLIHRLFKFLGITLKMKHGLDSTAARGMCNRIGVGKVKHLEIKTLWLQQFTSPNSTRGDEKIELIKIDTNDMGSDLGTKCLTESRIRHLSNICGMRKIESGVISSIPVFKPQMKESPVVGGVCSDTPANLRNAMLALVTCLCATLGKSQDMIECADGTCAVQVTTYTTGPPALYDFRTWGRIRWATFLMFVFLLSMAMIGIMTSAQALHKCVTTSCCCKRAPIARTPQPRVKNRKRNMQTQSQTTYKISASGSARFTPLGDSFHGAWEG